ncbi:IclR family transcriptional regulator [Vineibacter terrae]|uniref:IclR family transcriptional regulator n=1 Tax=Vineibacter terrae TaxID=2586908 RepID=UPI002E31FC50|nr:helix-turn-helix domain-containing protein [Vineibacter terrae]HEX2890671.1 helix-turn-helix domain-containing protein [Vineibacter terrae]
MPVSVGAIDKTEPKGAQAIHRAMGLLAVVGRNNTHGIRLKELAAQTGLHVATAHRLLNALAWNGMVIFDGFSKRYYLGVQVHALIDATRYGGIQPRLASLMETLARRMAAVIYAYLPLMNDIISIKRVGSKDTVLHDTGIGDGVRYPLGIGAAGVAILATMPPEQARAIAASNSERYADYHTSTSAVLQAVRNARQAGYGLNQGVIHNTFGIGTVIRNSRGEVSAAISAVYSVEALGERRLQKMAGILLREVKAFEPLEFPSA